MGYSTSWIATTLTRDDARDHFQVRPTGQRSEFAEFTLSDALLPGGWYLIVANNCDWAEGQDLAKISSHGELVTAYVEEHVMVSGASHWRSGEVIWTVEHDSQISDDHLIANGSLPTGYQQIADELLEEQRNNGDCDYLFDIPVRTAQLLTDYRHDEDGPWSEEEPFEILEPIKPWWRFW